MRKITVILLTFTMILTLCACGAEERQNPVPADETAPEVVTQIIEAPSTTDDGETAEAPAERGAADFGFDTKTVKLNSGYEMPILGIGTYALSDEQAENSIYWALRDGYRLIDTARIYGNESGVGRGIQRAIDEGLVKREDIFVTTKMWTSDYDDGERAIEASLQRLGLDYVDLMILHHSQPSNDVQAYQAMEKAVSEGKLRSIGLSNYYEPADFDRLVSATTIKPALLQNETHPYHQSKKSFDPEEHRDSVMEYVYYGKQCFTIDDGGIIKCWDVLSGRLEYELESADPLGVTDFSRKGFFKISRDSHWLAAKVQEIYDSGTHVYVQVFDLTNPDSPPKQIRPTAKHNLLTYFVFTEDSQNILMLCDRKVIYCVDVETLEPRYSGTFDLYKQSELYADSADSDIFVYTAEYDTYETDRSLMRSWINDDEEDEGGGENEDWDYSSDEDDEELSDSILCELRMIVPSAGTMRTLYTFAGEPGTAPTVSFMAREKCFLLYNHEGKQIERFDCVSKQSENILPELTEGQDTPPTEIHPHPEREGECFIMYPNICFAVDVRPNGSGDILMTYSISGVEKLIPDSDEGGELEFKTAVVPVMNRFIVGNDTNTYEWDTANDTVIRKYSSVFYDCTAFFPNAAKDRCILVHRHNGVSLFGDSPIKLLHQYCFQEPGYVVDISCYDETHDVLAMVFARPDHEKVLVMDLATGRERMVFSSLHMGETIENLCFSDDGNRLLITTQYRCLECDPLKNENPAEIAVSGENERFAAGHYRGDEIEIAVVEHTENAEPHIKPQCVYYRRVVKDGTVSFLRSWCYLMLELKKEQFQYFIYQDGDLGVGGANGDDGFQTYWVTGGFFLERLPELEKFFKPVCYRWQGNRRLKMEKEFLPLDEIFVWHRHEITNRYRVGNSGFSYMYLADKRSEAIITENREYLSYQETLKGLTYQKLRDTFRNDFKDVHQDTCWSYAVPWRDGSLIGCFEGYYLTGVAASDNRLLEPIEFFPGISIFGCRFKGIQADQETRNVVAANGGIL